MAVSLRWPLHELSGSNARIRQLQSPDEQRGIKDNLPNMALAAIQARR